ncbi:MAG: gliding motility-associated C-terminal domain-containing protein [Bacteroidota bacterium]|nr:gliding motility-associated C-terminal domain-containing protein [Bacteroidota bacterium]
MAPFDGQIEVGVIGGGSTFGYIINLISGNNPSGTLLSTIGPAASPNLVSAPTLTKGDYYVEVIDQDPANLPCPLASVHRLEQRAFGPQITLDQIVENTACDVTASPDGKIELTATADSQQNTIANPTDFMITGISPAPVGLAIPINIPDNGTSSGLLSGFGPQSYTITVTDANSGCATDAVVNIPDQPVLPTIFTVASFNESYCAPLSNGRIEVTSVGVGAPEPPLNYEFEWYSSSDVSTPANRVYAAVGGGGTTGEVFNGSKAGWSFGPTPGAGNGNRTYYVRGRRITGSGIGCFTQLEQQDVIDVHKTPDLTLTTFDNTSCLPGTGEGVLRAVTNIESDPLDGNVINGTYSYSWSPDPAGGNTSPANLIGRMVDFDMTSLTDNTYTVTTINSVNGCSTTGTAVIKTNPLPVTLLSYSKTDQLICNPDGSVNVTAIQIDATKTTANTVYNFNTAANLVANFDFKWFDSNNDGDGNPATYVNTAIQNGGVDINDDVLTDDGALTAQPFANMGQGTYYVVAIRKPGMSPGAGCTTVPVRVDVGRTVNDPVITALHPFANTSCEAGTVEGRIELAVQTASGVPAEAGSTYSYTWTQGDPVGNPGGAGNINNVANTTATSLVTLPQGYLTPPAIGPAFKDDTYTITVLNDYSGCSVTGQAVVTRQKFPVTLISFTKQDQLICGPDGKITVTQVTIDGSTSNLPLFNYSTPADLATNFDFAWFDSNNDGDNDPNTFSTSGATLQSGGAPITDVVLSEDPGETTQPFANMGPGAYYVLATRKPGMIPGAGCSTLPVRVNIEDKHINPVITAIEPFANTSCDAAVVEGRIELTVDTDSGVPAESGSTYTYSWVQADPVGNPGGAGNINNVANATATSLVTIPQGYVAPPAIGPALKDDTYTITVRNDYSNCTTTGQVVITPQRYPITLISFTKQDQLICGPDGRITVTQVTIDGSTSNLPLFNYSTPPDLAANFDFAWFDSNNDGDNDPNTFSVSGATLQSGGAPITDVVLSEDPVETTQPFATMGLGSYYVLATRKPGMTPGAGCSTLPVRVNIEDKHINPVITAIEPFANTSCDASIVEGRIELTVATASGVPAEAGSTYTYSWVQADPVGNPGGAGNINNVANATATSLVTIPQGYVAPPAIGPALKDDTYTITVRNDYSNCTTTGQAVITPQRYPITLISFTKQDQLICDPDGRITVTGVTIDGRTSNLPVYNFMTAPDLRTNFDFAWFDSNNDGDDNPGTFNTTIPLTDGINPLTDVVLSEDAAETVQPFATMGAGSYYVVAKRKPGMTPGAGCLTEPVRVNIEDLHSDPRASFAFTPNSSCDPMDPNGQLIATAQERDGTTDAYTFAWTLNTASLPGVITQTGVSPISQLDHAYEGDYVLEVVNTTTGCTFTSGLTVNLDLNVSLPNIINVDTTDPTNCIGNGSAEVTSISVGGGPPVTGAVLGTGFQYEWYDDDFVPGNLLANTAPLLPALTAGKYYVLVQDLLTDCKSAPTEVVIDDDNIVYPVIAIRQTALQISCITTSGTAGLEATADLGQTDANPNYSFIWFNNLDAAAPAIASTSAITDLLDGDYSVTVTNSATGCSSQDIYIIKDDSETFMPQLSLNTEGRIDCLNPDGTLLAREVGQNQGNNYPFPINYTTEYYIGENADVSQPGMVMANVTGFNRNWLEQNLDVGPYTVKITDNNTGCSVFKVDAVEDLRTPPIVAIMEDNPLINCDPTIANGQLSATADDGRVGGYQFNWFSGVSATGAVVSNNNKLIGISLGDFTVRVTNETTHCFADATSGVSDGRLAPPAPTAVLVFDRTRCDYPDGWVAANVGGVTFNYTFDWYDGTALKSAPDFAGVNYQHRDIGSYTVTAMDQITGCVSAPTSVEVKDLRVIPEVIVNTTPSYCEELPGSVGGNGTAQIQLNPADVVSDEVTWSLEGDATVIGIGSYVTNILPGFYQANVVTSQGCPASGVGEVRTEVFSYNLVSTNGDRKNDDFRIDCITQFPNNNVKIFNRAGVLVYEADGYDNNDVVFQGIGERGVYTIGNELPVGTYFYIIDKRDGSKPKTGYLELVR